MKHVEVLCGLCVLSWCEVVLCGHLMLLPVVCVSIWVARINFSVGIGEMWCGWCCMCSVHSCSLGMLCVGMCVCMVQLHQLCGCVAFLCFTCLDDVWYVMVMWCWYVCGVPQSCVLMVSILFLCVVVVLPWPV